MRYGLLLLFAFTSCSPKIVTFLNEKENFGSYHSYTIVNVKINKRQLEAETTKLLGVLESQIKLQMEDHRNYEPKKSKPDLILRYELISNTRTDTNNNSTLLNPFGQLNSRILYESVILIELLNQNSKKLVWQGSYDLTQNRKDAKNEKAIQKAIDLIFTTYPYKAGEPEPDQNLTVKKK